MADNACVEFSPTELTDHLDIFIQYFPMNIFQLLDCLTDDSAAPTIGLPWILIFLNIQISVIRMFFKHI